MKAIDYAKEYIEIHFEDDYEILNKKLLLDYIIKKIRTAYKLDIQGWKNSDLYGKLDFIDEQFGNEDFDYLIKKKIIKSNISESKKIKKGDKVIFDNRLGTVLDDNDTNASGKKMYTVRFKNDKNRYAIEPKKLKLYNGEKTDDKPTMISLNPILNNGYNPIYNEAKNIVESVVKNLKKRNLLKEFPGESKTTTLEDNQKTSTIQDCITECTTAKEILDEMVVSSLDTEEENKLKLIQSKLEFVLTSLNKIVNPENEETLGEAIEMDINDVMNNPDEAKKLSDKNVDVMVVDKSKQTN